MHVMNNNIKKVVFYSTRQIHPYFSDKEHLISSNSLINYFSGLHKNDGTRDNFSIWLSDLAFLSFYQQKLEDLCVEEDSRKLNEILSIVTQTKNKDPHDVDSIVNCLGSHDQEQDLFWKKAIEIFSKLQDDYENDTISFEPSLFDEYKERILSGGMTHLNRDKTESKSAGGNLEDDKAKLKHRLGIYHREYEDYAVAAIWPWAEEMEEDHDMKWKTVAVNAIREIFPKCEEIYLVMHDKDFKWCQKPGEKRDQIVFKRRPLSNWNKDTEGGVLTSAEDLLISYIVFQHDNEHVMGPIKKSEHTPKEVWYAIGNYLREVDKILSEADEKGLIAEKHNSSVE